MTGTGHAGAVNDDMIINNMFSVIIDPAALGDAAAIAGHIERVVAWVKNSPPAPGVSGVLVAGEPEERRRIERRRGGVPIDQTTWAELAAVAASLGVAVPAV